VVPVAGEAGTDTVPSAVSTAMAQTLVGVPGAKVVRGLPARGLRGGVEATALTAPGLVGPLDLGAQTHLGLLGRAARLPLLLLPPSLLLSRESLLLLWPTASR
jgi:hypothetical protein